MNVTLEIKEPVRRSLERMASDDGKALPEFLSDLIARLVREDKSARTETRMLMRLSETSFDEWDNPDDAIYDNL